MFHNLTLTKGVGDVYLLFLMEVGPEEKITAVRTAVWFPSHEIVRKGDYGAT